MKLSKINLQNFKNYPELALTFSDRLNCIVGLNGSGKTNLLDAIHYLAFTKSAFVATDNQNIRDNSPFFLIKGTFESKSHQEILCYQERNQKKIFKYDQKEYDRISDHIGKILLILHTPYDSEIIRDSSEYRRKWVDGCISQHDHQYLEDLILYQKILRQRNALLKKVEGSLNTANASLLDMYDENVINFSKNLADKRNRFVGEIRPFFESNIRSIVAGHESSVISYKSHVNEAAFEEKYRDSRQKDLLLQRTTMGAHRDDYLFFLEDKPIRKFGSQGQQKSFLISLRLTQYDYLFEKLNERPILLLDDVFDKLDDERIEKLIRLLSDSDRFDQIFITDARKERSVKFFDNIRDKKIFEISKGVAKEL